VNNTSAVINLFFITDTATTRTHTLSLHDALPISRDHLWQLRPDLGRRLIRGADYRFGELPLVKPIAAARGLLALRRLDRETDERSEEHTSELQSRFDLVCRLLLEKKHPRSHTIAT